MTSTAVVDEAPRAPIAMRRRRSRARTALLLLLTMGVATLLGCVFIEGAFRLLVNVTDVPYYFWDPVIGPRRVPNVSGHYVSGGHVDTHYHFNAQGWNSPRNYETMRQAGVRRVCLLGDSFVEALHVNPGQSLFAVAERAMSRPDRQVEWYAFGISGWGTAQQYELLRHYVLDYRPDTVLLLFVENDPLDSSPYLFPIEPQLCTYALDAEAQLVLMPANYWQRPAWKQLLIESAVARYFILQKGLIHRGQRTFAQAPGLQLREGAYGNAPPRLIGAEKLPIEERETLTWLLIQKLLEAARDQCRAQGAQFAVAFRGNVWRIEAALGAGEHQAPPLEEDPHCLGARHSEMGREQLQPICERLGIPYLDLTEPLAEFVAEAGRSHIFPDDNHYNEVGHAGAGEALAAWVETLWQSPPPGDAPAQENPPTEPAQP